MKLALTLGALIACTCAYALTLQMPHTIIKDELGRDVWCGPPVFTHQADGPYDDGSYAGLLYQKSSCSSGGRGSKPRYFSACASVTWEPDGTLGPVDVIWTTLPPAAVRPVTDCITG